MRQAFFLGDSNKKTVKFRDMSFPADVNINNYTRDEDGAYRIYSGRVWLVHTPNLDVAYQTEDGHDV